MMKRAAEALKRQDWAAIIIEFLLVVIGVLLAFQISEWAAGREDRRVRAESVERLLHESEQDVARLRDIMTPSKTLLLPNMKIAAANLTNPNPTPKIAEIMRDSILGSAVLPKPDAPDTVYRELVASGRFGEIGDVRMRDAVSDYASALSYLNQAVDYARDGISRQWDGDTVHFAYGSATPGVRRVDVDFRKLSTNRTAQDQFIGRLGSQQFVINNYNNALLAAEVMCREVARVAGRPCQPPPPQRS